MRYDFDTVLNRRCTDSVKWDVKANELPMWVADMDFKTAPEIINALEQKVQNGVFRYEEPHENYFNAVADWYESQHNFRPNPDWMILTTGVVPTISSVVRRVTNQGDNVVVQSPVYDIFYHSIENNGRHVLSSDLVYDKKSLSYSIDFGDLEDKLAQPLSTLMILCNPANPVGKIWSRYELSKIAQLCKKHHVILLSDEIHGDLTFHDEKYTPAFSLDEDLIDDLIVCVSPSKTFNVAALHAATAIVPNDNLRAQVSRGINNDELGEPNLAAIPGTIAAYEYGADWLKHLKAKLLSNYQAVEQKLKDNPYVKLVPSEATYLLWLDVSALTDNSKELEQYIRQETGLYLSSGDVYRGDGNYFLRMNIACPSTELKDGLNRLVAGLSKFAQSHK